MELSFLFVLFFVIISAAIIELVLRCPWAVAAVVAIISLIVFAFFSGTFGNIFIVWIIIYTLAAWVTAVIICKLLNRFRNNNCNRNDF